MSPPGHPKAGTGVPSTKVYPLMSWNIVHSAPLRRGSRMTALAPSSGVEPGFFARYPRQGAMRFLENTTGAADLRSADALDPCLATLTCPVSADMDISHRPPQFTLINHGLATVPWDAGHAGSVHERLV